MEDPGRKWIDMAKETLNDIPPERRKEIEEEILEANLLNANKNYPTTPRATSQPSKKTLKEELGSWRNGSGSDRATAEKEDEEDK